MEIELIGCHQDGGDFWTDESPAHLIISYSCVLHDSDLQGAKEARSRFARDFPAYARYLV